MGTSKRVYGDSLALMAQLTAAAYLRVNDAAWRLLSDGPLRKQGVPEREARLNLYRDIPQFDSSCIKKLLPIKDGHRVVMTTFYYYLV